MTELDLQAAHKYFAAHCFNETWALLDKPIRTPEEQERMLSLTMASYYHWTQRSDFSPTSHSIALWQIARVYAVLEQPENALQFGRRCLEVASQEGVGLFYQAYAHEALARAYKLLGEAEQTAAHLTVAQGMADQLADPDDRGLLVADLKSIAAE